MSQPTIDVIAAIGITCLASIPLLGLLALIERKDKARSRKMLGKGKSVRLR